MGKYLCPVVPEQKIYQCQVSFDNDYEKVVGEVIRNPKDPNKWGIRNLSGMPWTITTASGEIKNIDHNGVVPVMAPLTHDGQGLMLNTNADTIAGETAKALAELFDVTLVFCFEKKGVLSDADDDDSVIPVITPELFKEYVEKGIIQGGMIPKLENSFSAIDAGVSQVVITLASAIHQEGCGTIIKK